MFMRGETYSRADVRKLLGFDKPRNTGGNWSTGHVTFEEAHFLFCGIEIPGTTGQNYNNYFVGEDLIWHPKGNQSPSARSFSKLISGKNIVHIFFRSKMRDRFTYFGASFPVKVTLRPQLEARWAFDADESSLESPETSIVSEGKVTRISVARYERNRIARWRCIMRWGIKCAVCAFDFEETYGSVGEGFIHVHHLIPISAIGEDYQLNPEEDLRPLCPNCHAMVHRTEPPRSIEEMIRILKTMDRRRELSRSNER